MRDIYPKSSGKYAFLDDSLLIKIVILNVLDHLKSGAPESSILYFLHFTIYHFFYPLARVRDHHARVPTHFLVCDLQLTGIIRFIRILQHIFDDFHRLIFFSFSFSVFLSIVTKCRICKNSKGWKKKKAKGRQFCRCHSMRVQIYIRMVIMIIKRRQSINLDPE